MQNEASNHTDIERQKHRHIILYVCMAKSAKTPKRSTVLSRP